MWSKFNREHVDPTSSAEVGDVATLDRIPPKPQLDLGIEKYIVEIPNTLAQLNAAIASLDDGEIWRLHQTCSDTDLFMDWVGNLSSSLVMDVRHPRDASRKAKEHHCLFVVPIVLSHDACVPPAGAPGNRALLEPVRQLLEEWFGRTHTSVNMFEGLVDYADVSTWSPAGIHCRVRELAKSGGFKPLDPDSQTALAAPAPRLMFLVGAARRMFGYPELPAERPGVDIALSQRVTAQLMMLTDSYSSVMHVGRAELFADGVRSGLIEWIRRLREQMDIASWSMHPATVDSVLLRLDAQYADWAGQIAIRTHHIGLQGLDLVLAELDGLKMLP